MTTHPYERLPENAFWTPAIVQKNPNKLEDIYIKKFDITDETKIATAGSCFAQHISNYLKNNNYNVLDFEPAPLFLAKELHQEFGYSMYSARYGNIYTVRQLLQLTKESMNIWTPSNWVWEKNKRYYDALRPNIEPGGFDSINEVVEQRKYHLERIIKLFKSMDLLIFTLGLTEMWVHKNSGTVYPTAPGVVAGEFDKNVYKFENAQFNCIIEDFKEFESLLHQLRNGKPYQILLTVSPVPLKATASNEHVLVASTYSKAILRAVAGELTSKNKHISYFPSYEIINNPKHKSGAFLKNLRDIQGNAVDTVMSHFFHVHGKIKRKESETELRSCPDQDHLQEVLCEEALIEAFDI